MSYAEYGAQIFTSKKYKIDKLFIRNDELSQVKSGCRLKINDSCWDIRAWSQNHVDKFRYFREVTGCSSFGKVLPIEFLLDVLKDSVSQEEIESLRCELEKYKSLKLTPEQEEQLGLQRDNQVYSVYYRRENENIMKKNKNTTDIVTEESSDLRIDEVSVERQGESSFIPESIVQYQSQSDDTISNEGPVTQRSHSRTTVNENYESLYSSTPERSEYDDESLFDSEDNKLKVSTSHDDISSSIDDCQTNNKIIKNEARLIALDNKLNEQNMELEDLKDLNEKLEKSVREKEKMINDLKKKLETLQSANDNVYEINSRYDAQVREWRRELSKGKSLIDQLQGRLEEKNHICNDLEVKIQQLYGNASDASRLRSERDSLTERLDEINRLMEDADLKPGSEGLQTLIEEHSELSYLNDKLSETEKQLSIVCSDQEEEIAKLTECMKKICDDNKIKLAEKKQVIDELTTELKEKNKIINNYEDKIALIRQESQDAFDEYCFQQDESYDNVFATYFKKSLDEINEFSNDLRGVEDERQVWFDKIEKDRNIYNRKLHKQENEIDKLRKLNDELKKNVINFDGVKKTNSQMKTELIQLHRTYQDLTNDKQKYLYELNSKKEKILQLKNEKDNLLSRVEGSEATVAEKDLKIEALKSENLEISLMLKKNEEKVENIYKEMKSLNTENENMNEISRLQEEIQSFKKDKQKLEERIKDLKEELKNYENSNKSLDKKYSDLLFENNNLIKKMAGIKKDISREFKSNIVNTESLSQLDLIRKSIGTFKNRFDTLDNEAANNSSNNYLIVKEEIDNNIGDNEKNYEKLIDKEELIKSLTREKDELSVRLNHERIAHENKLEELMEGYEQKLKIYVEDHNASVKRLQAQYFQSDYNINVDKNLADPMKNVIGNYDYLYSENKNPIIMENEISNIHCHNNVDFSRFTDDSKAKQFENSPRETNDVSRYFYTPRNNRDNKGPIKSTKPTVSIKGKTFMGHCSVKHSII